MELNASYWDNRYRNNDSPWDIGYESPAIRAYFEKIKDKNARILIPGAGNAYEAEFLFRHGFKNVFVLDFSHKALENFSKRVVDFPVSQMICCDFFEHKAKYDFVIEQTFFCAIDPVLRPNYVIKMHNLLNESGRLVGLLFNDPNLKGNPPYGGTINEYKELFMNHFLLTIEESKQSISPRAGREVFIDFLRK